MKLSRRFWIILSFLLVIIILTIVMIAVGLIENQRESEAYDLTSKSIVLKNDAITPDFATASAKSWTVTPTK